MWWGSSPAGPRNRREMRAAYGLLSEDIVALSGELGRARLENIRLGAMVDALAHDLGRARGELTAARTDLGTLQNEAAVIRPLVTELMAENRELRGQLAINQQSITELTGRLTDLLEAHLAATRAITARGSVVTGDTAPARPAITDLRTSEPAAAAAAGGSAERLRLIRHTLD